MNADCVLRSSEGKALRVKVNAMTALSNNVVGRINTATSARRGDNSPTTDDSRNVRVSIIYPDSTVEHCEIAGTEATLFAALRRLVGHRPLRPVPIDDYDGLAATGWTDDRPDRLTANPLASELANRPIAGPMVVTGLGRGETESVTSVHEGLRRVLDRMSAAAVRSQSAGIGSPALRR
jgi:hypothetical protein